MTRYQYANNRSKYESNLLQLIYIHYRDESNESVDPSFFISAFQNWIMSHTNFSIQEAISLIIKYLDRKYEVTLVQDIKNGEILKII